jgi:hypothetical protein
MWPHNWRPERLSIGQLLLSSSCHLAPQPQPPMTTNAAHRKSRTYALLLFMQTLAALIILAGTIPIYEAIFAAPGQQLSKLPQSPVLLIAAVVLFHCTYWFRLLRVPISVRGQSLILSHFVLFAGRLTFVFGTAFFTLIVLRHFPELAEVPSPFRLITRTTAMLTILFSLYCYSSELERLGIALRPPARG